MAIEISILLTNFKRLPLLQFWVLMSQTWHRNTWGHIIYYFSWCNVQNAIRVCISTYIMYSVKLEKLTSEIFATWRCRFWMIPCLACMSGPFFLQTYDTTSQRIDWKRLIYSLCSSLCYLIRNLVSTYLGVKKSIFLCSWLPTFPVGSTYNHHELAEI